MGPDAEIVGERLPRGATGSNAKGNTDEKADQCDGRRLPRDCECDLAANEPEGLEQPHLAATASEAGQEEVQECRDAEGDDDDPEDEWEVDGSAEVDQVGRRVGEVRLS